MRNNKLTNKQAKMSPVELDNRQCLNIRSQSKSSEGTDDLFRQCVNNSNVCLLDNLDASVTSIQD